MTISYKTLKAKIINLSACLFTMPDSKSNSATAIWIKFRADGYFLMISFARPLPAQISLISLVGGGNALDVSDKIRVNLLEYNDTLEVKEVLNNSINYKNNDPDTVLGVIELFKIFNGRFLHYSQ